jgi:hypothetical protein
LLIPERRHVRSKQEESSVAALMLDHVDSETSDGEIKEFLMRYGFPPFDDIEHLPGDPGHSAVLLTFNEVPPDALRALQPRIQNVFWKSHKINAVVMHTRAE